VTDTPIYTIGYGAREIDAFIAVLQRYGIAYLIDVRSSPYSRYKPDFSRERLEEHLRRAGIRYVYMGDSLGGRPADPTCYDSEGHVDYAKVVQRDFYLAGIERLATAYSQGLAVSIMCSEGRPENCHRGNLIGKTLAERGLSVAHIDENDDLIDQRQLELRHTGGQLSFFGDMGRVTSRKSYRAQEGEDEEDG
jgi:uncharacterized protein (DUF488 family)